MNQNTTTKNASSDVSHRQRLIRIKDVIRLTGISKSYIYQLVNQGHFPKSIQLIPGGKSVAWVEDEVLSWIEQRIEDRNNMVSGD